MKKLTAILLLVLFVFNTVGYRLVFEYLQSRADATFVAKLDQGNYDPNDLVTIKIPMNLPYQNSWSDYERVNGEITIAGKDYKYVKRTVSNDTMILLCIAHDEKTQLQKKANDYFGKVNDLPGSDNNSSKKADALKQLTTDYIVTDFIAFESNINVQAVSNLYGNATLQTQFLPVNVQPPEVLG